MRTNGTRVPGDVRDRDGTSAPPTALGVVQAFSECVLELHRKCRELPVRAFQSFIFEQLGRVVPLDSGFFTTGTIQQGTPLPHDFYLHRQPPELVTSWETVKHLDKLAFLATGSPGRTFVSSAQELYADVLPVLEHCERFSMRHLACTAAVAPRIGSFVVLSAYRHEVSKPFSESERAALELLMPHVVESSRQSRIAALLRGTHTTLQNGGGAAIVNRKAIVLEAEQGFLDLVAQHYPQWNGPALPRELGELASVNTLEKRIVGRLTFQVDPSGDVLLLRARSVLPVDMLSRRERQVALLFASGETTKEIAEHLGIAPNTVRVHVSRAYEKLGVVNKAELASMLARFES